MQLAADSANTELIALLLKAGADPESPNADGETALHLVARAGNVEAAKLLLKAGAKVDPVESFGGQTPLMWAVARRHPEMVELLASKGANVNARSAIRDYQRVVQAESRAKSLDRGGLTPLLYAARENCRECVEILLKHRADVNLGDPSEVAPLSVAMLNSNWDIAKRLVEAGADVNQWDWYRPLAAARGHRQHADGEQPQPARQRPAEQGHRARAGEPAGGARRESEPAAAFRCHRASAARRIAASRRSWSPAAPATSRW